MNKAAIRIIQNEVAVKNDQLNHLGIIEFSFSWIIFLETRVQFLWW